MSENIKSSSIISRNNNIENKKQQIFANGDHLINQVISINQKNDLDQLELREQRLKNLEEQLNNKSQQLEEANAKKSQLEKLNEENRKQLEQSNADLKNKKDEVFQCKDELLKLKENYKAENCKLSTEISNLKQQLNQARANFEAEKLREQEKLQLQHKQQIESYSQQLSSQKQEIAILNNIKSKAAQQEEVQKKNLIEFSNLKQQNQFKDDQIKQSKDREQALQIKVDDQGQQINQLSVEKTKLQEQIIALHNEHQQKINQKQLDVQKLQSQLNTLSISESEFKEQSTQKQKQIILLSSEIDELKKKIASISTQNRDLIKKVGDLEKQLTDTQLELEKKNSINNEIMFRLGLENTTNMDLKNELLMIQNNEKLLQSQISMLKPNQKKLMNDNLDLSQKANNLEYEVKEAKIEISNLQLNQEQLTIQNNNYKIEQNRLKDENQTMKNELNVLLGKNINLENQNSKLHQEVNRLAGEKMRCAELQKQLSQCQLDLLDKDRTLQDQIEQLSKLKNSQQCSENQQYLEMQNRFDTVTQKLNQTNSSINLQLKNEQQLNLKLKNDLATMETSNQNNCQKLEELQNQIKSQQEYQKKLEAQLKSIKDKLLQYETYLEQVKQANGCSTNPLQQQQQQQQQEQNVQEQIPSQICYDQLYSQLRVLESDYILKKYDYKIFIQRIIDLIHFEAPCALLMSESDRAKDYVMKQLFPSQKQFQNFSKLYLEDLKCNIINTSAFQFDDIAEREQQIEQYIKIFKQNQFKVSNIWIAVPFERVDLMKKKVAEVYKYVNQLQVTISIVVTDFHLSSNTFDDQNQLTNLFKQFQVKNSLFIGAKTKRNEIIEQLKSTQQQNQQNWLYPLNTKNTIFEEITEQQMNCVLNDFCKNIK